MKEKEEALRKKVMIENLKESRAKQLEQQERLRRMKAKAEYEQMEYLLQ